MATILEFKFNSLTRVIPLISDDSNNLVYLFSKCCRCDHLNRIGIIKQFNKFKFLEHSDTISDYVRFILLSDDFDHKKLEGLLSRYKGEKLEIFLKSKKRDSKLSEILDNVTDK